MGENNIPSDFEYGKGWWDYVELVRRFASKFDVEDVRVVGHYVVHTPPPEEQLPMPAVALIRRDTIVPLVSVRGRVARSLPLVDDLLGPSLAAAIVSIRIDAGRVRGPRILLVCVDPRAADQRRSPMTIEIDPDKPCVPAGQCRRCRSSIFFQRGAAVAAAEDSERTTKARSIMVSPRWWAGSVRVAVPKTWPLFRSSGSCRVRARA